MEKILLVIHARQPATASIDFACRVAALTSSKLTGLFVENLFDSATSATQEEKNYSETREQEDSTTVVENDTDRAVKLFVQACAIQGISAETTIDKGEPIQQVIYESRFADLLILDPRMDFYGAEEQLPTHFTREVLASSECPVLLAPGRVDEMEEVVFCYDGSPSSIYALKQFTYLFPVFHKKRAVLLEVDKTGNAAINEDHRRIILWLKAHYETVTYQVLRGSAKDELFTYFFKKRGKFIVLGSYGRNTLSNFFRHSTAEILIRTVDLPLFITHFNH